MYTLQCIGRTVIATRCQRLGIPRTNVSAQGFTGCRRPFAIAHGEGTIWQRWIADATGSAESGGLYQADELRFSRHRGSAVERSGPA